MNTKSVAVEFNTSEKMYETFKNMNITDFIVSDENDNLAEVEVTAEQFDTLCKMDEVVYASEL